MDVIEKLLVSQCPTS